MKDFSILLGAGFSRDALIPDRSLVNEKLKNLRFENFMISSVGIAHFIGENYPNSDWLNIYERMFVEFFIKKYYEKFSEFDYEELYEYAMGLYKNPENSKELEEIYDEFIKEKPHFPRKKLDALSIVLRTINQLVDTLLYFNSDIFKSGVISKYSEFLRLIDFLVERNFRVNIFTLNHDLLMESLLKPRINYTFSDGFQYEFTPYYIKQGDFQYRIKSYTNNYSQNVCLFKLHGSVDNYIINYSEPFDMVKIPKKLNHINLYREKKGDNAVVETENIWTLYEPSILTGLETKIENYSSHQYYSDIFAHFASRLETSKLLLVIGYGLSDTEINKIIFNNYDFNNNKILIVKPSKGNESFYRNRNIIHYGEGKVGSDIKIDDIIKYLDM